MKRTWTAFVVPAVLLALLGVLAIMQYRWIGGVSEGERARMQAAVQARASQLAEAFDTEITQAYFALYRPDAALQPGDPVQGFADQYAQWAASSRHPRLIRGVFILRLGEPGGGILQATPGQPLAPGVLPPDVAKSLGGLKDVNSGQLGQMRSLIIGDIPAFLVPLMTFGGLTPRMTNVSVAFAGLAIVWLDRSYLEKELLPGLAARYLFARDGFDYKVAVIAPKEGRRLVYVSDRHLSRDAFAHPDVTSTLFQIRWEQLSALLPRSAGGAGAAAGAGARGQAPAGAAPRQEAAAMPFRSDPNAGEWQLLLVHRAGSLDRAIAVARRRNIAISFGVVLLVAASIGSIVVSTRRAQRLARQQIEFVAGVSHELRTPLSVIRSAGENLSDGVIAEPEQVKRYGALIAEEGRRLSEMVEQVMAFAGFNAGRDLSERTAAEVSVLIANAVADNGALIERNGFTLERCISPGLPAVVVNTAALTQAIANLISNAVKYSGPSRWVRVTAEAAPGSRRNEIRITVEDRGIGIRPDEQDRIFEPFFRSRDVLASTMRGSGLGLSLVRRIVEAHGGTISVRSSPGQGSAFTLHLPCGVAGETA